MAREDPTIYMRMPADLKEKLDSAALENRRSITAEVAARLEQSFDGGGMSKEIASMLARAEYDRAMQAANYDLLQSRYSLLGTLFQRARFELGDEKSAAVFGAEKLAEIDETIAEAVTASQDPETRAALHRAVNEAIAKRLKAEQDLIASRHESGPKSGAKRP